MQRYTCAQVGDTHWAATRVNPGNTVFFLQSNGHTWQAMTADTICGAASAGLPSDLLSYCAIRASSSSPSVSPASTTSASSG